MPIISKPLYVYLQRPDDGAWVTVGRDACAAYLDALLARIEADFRRPPCGSRTTGARRCMRG
jgi:hypothetical protein